MPWSPKDAKSKTKKADTPKKQRQWADIADSALKSGKSEATAIKMASGVVAKSKRKK